MSIWSWVSLLCVGLLCVGSAVAAVSFMIMLHQVDRSDYQAQRWHESQKH